MTDTPPTGPSEPRGHGFAVQTVHCIDGETVREIRRTRRAADARAPIGRADLIAMLQLAIATPAAALGGPAGARLAARVLATADPSRHGTRQALFRRSLAAVGGWSGPEAASRFGAHLDQMSREIPLLSLELVRRSRPVFDIEGLDALRAALGQGRGAILWVADTLFASILVKRALHGAGLPLRQVSTPAHGLSRSRFGRRMLNPLSVAVEDRYLSERMLFDLGDEADVLRRIKRALAAGEPVAMTMNTYAGSTFYEAPFGQSGRLLLATSAPRLAVSEGAPLFTATLLETEPFRRYRLRIGPDCAPRPDGEARARGIARTEAALRAATRARDQVLQAFMEAPEAFAQPGRTDMGLSAVRAP